MTATDDWVVQYGDNETGNGSGSAYEYEEMHQSCALYEFIIYAVVGGLVCILGCIGNVLAFVVFWCDKVKTSTSLLFQVGN